MSARIYSADEARALRDAATPGPWSVDDGIGEAIVADVDGDAAQVGSAVGQAARRDLRAEHHVVRIANAALLAAAPDLAASVEHHAARADDAEAEVQRLRARVATLESLAAGPRLVIDEPVVDAIDDGLGVGDGGAAVGVFDARCDECERWGVIQCRAHGNADAEDSYDAPAGDAT